MNQLARTLMTIGIIITLVGAVLALSPRIPWLGRLPGDILVRKGNVTFFFPLATSFLLSLFLSLLFWIFRR